MKKLLLIPLLLLLLAGCENETPPSEDTGVIDTLQSQLTSCKEDQKTLSPEAVELQKKMADACIRLGGIPIQTQDYPYMMSDCGFKKAYTSGTQESQY